MVGMTRVSRGSTFLALRLAGACAAACVLSAAGFAAPASSSDGDAALAQMQAATRSAHSFTARFEPTVPMSWVIVQPDRMRRTMPSGDGSHTDDWIVIGRQSYTRDGDKPWQLGHESVDGIRWDEIAPFLREGTTARALPDRVEDGTPAGGLDITLPASPPSRSIHVTCSYDKPTYRPRACWFQTVAKIYVTTTYEHWNDASNAIEPPPGVRVPIPAPSPAG
jgi:hypothetical protein